MQQKALATCCTQQQNFNFVAPVATQLLVFIHSRKHSIFEISKLQHFNERHLEIHNSAINRSVFVVHTSINQGGSPFPHFVQVHAHALTHTHIRTRCAFGRKLSS